MLKLDLLLNNTTYLQPATLNQAEFKVVSDLARSKNLFLMEAVWTRFFPLTYALEKVLFEEKAIGDIRRLQSDFSIDFIDSELAIPTIQKLLQFTLFSRGRAPSAFEC